LRVNSTKNKRSADRRAERGKSKAEKRGGKVLKSLFASLGGGINKDGKTRMKEKKKNPNATVVGTKKRRTFPATGKLLAE